MYLHISHDDKFLDYFIQRQRRIKPDIENKYLVYSQGTSLTHIKSPDVTVIKLYSREFWNHVQDFSVKRIYLHYFSPLLADLVLKIRKEIPVYWVFWGSDAFYLPVFQRISLDDFAFRFIKKHHPHLILHYKFLHLPVVMKWKYKIEKHLKAIKRIDYFCHYLKDDYDQISEVTGMKAQLLDFNYGSIIDISRPEDKLLIAKNSNGTRNSIIVGNSASESNNHISAFHYIKENDFDFESIYCPLSYAGFKDYINEVIRTGKYLFGKKFIPLESFLPKQDYDKILLKSTIFVQNHFRSQAFGNIAWQLFAGGNVIMNPSSSLYKYLTHFDLSMHTIGSHFNPLQYEEKHKNANLISDLLSEDNLNRRYLNIL